MPCRHHPVPALCPSCQVVTAVVGGRRPELPPLEELPGGGGASFPGLPAYIALMERCWAQRPQDRPDFTEVVAVLRWAGEGRRGRRQGQRQGLQKAHHLQWRAARSRGRGRGRGQPAWAQGAGQTPGLSWELGRPARQGLLGAAAGSTQACSGETQVEHWLCLALLGRAVTGGTMLTGRRCWSLLLMGAAMPTDAAERREILVHVGTSAADAAARAGSGSGTLAAGLRQRSSSPPPAGASTA